MNRACVIFAIAILASASVGAQTPSPIAPPVVDDPLLAPPPGAKTVASWDDALQLVRTQSPDLRSTWDNVERAQARTRVALAGILPSATAQLGYTQQFITVPYETVPGATPIYPPPNVVGFNATMVWPIGDPHAWFARRTADLEVTAAQNQFDEKRRTLAQSVVSTMLGTLATGRAAQLNREGLRGALERLALAEARTRFGGGTLLDVERAQQDLQASRAQVISGDESLRQAREAFGLALGSAEPLAAPGDLDLADFEKAVAGTCRLNDDIEQRPDIVAAKANVALADRAVTNIWWQSAPSFAIESQLQWANEVSYPPNTLFDVVAVLNIPIWDGGAKYGQLRDARGAADQANAALASARLVALVGHAQAERAVTVAGASRDVAQRQRDLAVSIDKRTREGYMHGLGTSLDLVTSAQALRQAEITLVLLQFQVAQARALAILSSAECSY